jgi:hypothetical protein
VSDSAPPETLDQPASASAEPTDAAEQPPRGEAQESPAPSIDATVPTATPARTGSARRDTQTTRAISPPSTTTRAPNLPSLTPRRATDEFANPTGKHRQPNAQENQKRGPPNDPHRSQRRRFLLTSRERRRTVDRSNEGLVTSRDSVGVEVRCCGTTARVDFDPALPSTRAARPRSQRLLGPEHDRLRAFDHLGLASNHSVRCKVAATLRSETSP